MTCTCDDSVGKLCNQHAVECARYKLIEWLRERYANCVSIAAQKTGTDRDGWMEDAMHFHLAIQLLLAEGSHE